MSMSKLYVLKLRRKDAGGRKSLANYLDISIKRFHMVTILLTNLNITNKSKKNNVKHNFLLSIVPKLFLGASVSLLYPYYVCNIRM